MKNQIQKGFPMTPFHRDEFLAPFDTLFDRMLSNTFPELAKEVGVDVFQKGAYPKCDIIIKNKYPLMWMVMLLL